MVSQRGWKRAFDKPIKLPNSKKLVTLKDAGKFITKLPNTEHEAPEWQVAIEALILLATPGWPTMLARTGVMRALNRHIERVFNPDRKEHHSENGSWHAIDDVTELARATYPIIPS